jgi:hypothetical protein
MLILFMLSTSEIKELIGKRLLVQGMINTDVQIQQYQRENEKNLSDQV